MKKPVRLQKYLAQCGVCSRRKAEELIRDGRICINGKVVTEMGLQITPGKNKVTFDHKVVNVEEEFLYFLLNKPKGYLTTLSDPQGRPVVTSLIKDSRVRLFPVGRLDLETEGALILTNDGNLAQKIQHPSFNTRKSYEAVISGMPTKEKIKQLELGIFLEGKMTAPATVTYLGKRGRNSFFKIIIHEGRKRQIRKMFNHIGHQVIHLKRTAYGKLTIGNLASGKYRSLKTSDLKKIFL